MMTDDRDEVVRRLAVANDQAAYEKTGNPLHVWFAIGRYGAAEPLPLWVRRYLLKITRELWRLALDHNVSPAAAQREMLQALGFGEQGRNVVSEIRQQREDSFPVAVYDVGRKENKGWAQVLADATGNPASGAQSRLRTFKKKVTKVGKSQARVSQPRPK